MQSKKLNMMTASGGALTHWAFSPFTVFLRAKLPSSKGKLENDLAKKKKQTHFELLQCFCAQLNFYSVFCAQLNFYSVFWVHLNFYSFTVFFKAWYPDVVPGCSRSKTFRKISKAPGYCPKTKSDPDACAATTIMMLMNVRTHFLQLFFHILLQFAQAVLFNIWKKTILLQEAVGILKTYSFRNSVILLLVRKEMVLVLHLWKFMVVLNEWYIKI